MTGFSRSGRIPAGILGLCLLAWVSALYAFSTGPLVPLTGATWPPTSPGVIGPLDEPTCDSCHAIHSNENARGTMALSFSGGNTYTPGVWKRVTITITPNPGTGNPVKYGFQASARLPNNAKAGRLFQNLDDPTQFPLMAVKCASSRTSALTDRIFPGCRAGDVEFIQHSQPFTGQGSSAYRLSFVWQPPDSNAGDVSFYATSVLAEAPYAHPSNAFRTSATLSYQAPVTPANPVYPAGTLGLETLDTLSNQITAINRNVLPLYKSVMTRDGSRLYALTSSGLVTLDPRTGTPSTPVRGGVGGWENLALSPDGSRLYAGGGDGVDVFDTSTGGPVGHFDFGLSDSDVLAVSPDGKRIYVLKPTYGPIFVVDATSLSQVAQITTADLPVGMAVSPDSSRLYVTEADNHLTIFSTATNSVLYHYALDPTPGPVVFSPDGSRAYVLSTGTVQKITTIEVATSVPLGIYTLPNVPGYSPFFRISPDGAYLYGGANELFGPEWNTGAWSLPVNPPGPAAAIPSAQGVVDIAVPAPLAAPDPPANVTGTPGGNQVAVSWTAPVNTGGSAVTGYHVQQATSPSGAFSDAIGCSVISIAPSCTVTGLTRGTAYYFRVAAVNAIGTGAYSVPSPGVTPGTFTDDPIRAGITPIRAAHVTELRMRIDALRQHVGLAGFSWTDPSLVGVAAKAVHVAELRTALLDAYDRAIAAGGNISRPSFTDPVLSPQTIVRATHIAELRAAVVNLEAAP